MGMEPLSTQMTAASLVSLAGTTEKRASDVPYCDNVGYLTMTASTLSITCARAGCTMV